MSTATLPNPGLAAESSLAKSILLEPVLVVGSALFWVCALPFVALSLLAVKVFETSRDLLHGRVIRLTPLILRVGPARKSSDLRDAAQARA